MRARDEAAVLCPAQPRHQPGRAGVRGQPREGLHHHPRHQVRQGKQEKARCLRSSPQTANIGKSERICSNLNC